MGYLANAPTRPLTKESWDIIEQLATEIMENWT
jgi:hypothetical protein